MASTENRLRYAAGLMLAAEDHNLTIEAKKDGRIFVIGEEKDVYKLQPEMCRFKDEISYLLASTKLKTDAFMRRIMASPASNSKGR